MISSVRPLGRAIHPGNDLSGFDHVTFIGQYLGDAADIFGVDVDFIGFQPAIAQCNAGRQLRVQPLPPVVRRAGATDHDDKSKRDAKPPSAARRRLHRRCGHRQAGKRDGTPG